MNYRRQEIRKAFSGTSTWIFQNESYRQWMDEDCRLLWIKGKPGSGKSTIMKRILDSFTGERIPNHLQLCFFFHRRGSQLQYTQLGMFRSLVHQLNCQVPLVRTMFDTAWAEKKRSQGGEAYARNWRLEEVRDLFSTLLVAAAEKRKIRIFVDALDEAGEDAAKDLLYYFHALSNDISEIQAHVSICFSCRRYPVFASHGGLEVWVDQENHDDITTYTVAELNMQLVKDTGHQKAVEILKRELIRKASGVFLWVALMLPLVTKDYNDGEFLPSILRRLDQVPSDLSQIYEYILTKVVDLEKRSRSLRFMQWIFFAERRLAGVCIIHALACDDNPIRWAQISVKDLDSTANEAQIEKSVLSLSGGLAEVEHNDDSNHWRSYVQFIHESVNDFWRKDQFHCLGFEPKNDPIGEIHYSLCAFCLDYSKLAFDMVPLDEDGDVQDKVINAFPFIVYAANSWLPHAKKAELRGVSVAGLRPRLVYPPEGAEEFQSRLLFFTSDYGLELDNLHRRHMRGATLLHMAAAYNLESLMRALLENGAEVNPVDFDGSSALAWAAGYRHHEEKSNKAGVQVLLDYGADTRAPPSESRDSPLSTAAKLGDEAVVRLLVEHGADVNAFVPGLGSHTNVTPLEAAVGSKKPSAVAIARFLLDSGADVNPRRQFGDGYGDSDFSVLNTALDKGTEELVQLLLERGAKINLPSDRSGSLLQYLVRDQEYGFVRLFLAHGAHVNADADEWVDTALGEAAKSGSQSLMRMLLEAGADVFRQTRWYGTLYQIAKRSEHDSEAKVRLLLEYGYGRRWALRSGISLARTAQQGSEAMLRLLLLAKVDKARDGYSALLRLAMGSDVEREGKVRLLLLYKYGSRWLNSDWASAASSFRRSEGVSEESDG